MSMFLGDSKTEITANDFFETHYPHGGSEVIDGAQIARVDQALRAEGFDSRDFGLIESPTETLYVIKNRKTKQEFNVYAEEGKPLHFCYLTPCRDGSWDEKSATTIAEAMKLQTAAVLLADQYDKQEKENS